MSSCSICSSLAPSKTAVAALMVRPSLTPRVVQRPAQVGLEDLADVHARGHAQRVEDDVDRRAVGQEGHVFLGQDLGDHALVAVTAGHLVADADLALGRDADADEAVDAGRQLVAVIAVELADVDDLAALAVGQAQAGVLHLAGLLAEDRAQQALLRGQLGLTLGRDLAHQDVARLDLGADIDDAVLVEVLEGILADVGDVPGDLLGAELGVTRLQLVLLDVDAGEEVLAHEAVRDDDGVLVVAALPAHESDEDVAAEGQLTFLCGGGVGEDRVLGHAHAHLHHGAVVDAGALVGANELLERVLAQLAVITFDGDEVRGHRGDHAGSTRNDHLAGVLGRPGLHAGAHDGRLRLQERHGLALHVGTHERAVGIVVFEERDERGGHGHDLLGAHIHVLDLGGASLRELLTVARGTRSSTN